MDEKIEALASSEDIAPAPGSTIPVTARSLDINELQAFPEKKLKALARDLDLYLHPARSRHQHILDIARASLGGGATVTAEGFLDQVSDSFAMLRWPKLNFLPLPEDVSVPRALVEQYQLRPGQKIAGIVRLPGQREKFLCLDEVTSIEGQPAQEWAQPTHFDKLTPHWARATRSHRRAATSGQDDPAKGNRKSDSSESPRGCAHPALGRRAPGRSDGLGARSRLPDLPFEF